MYCLEYDCLWFWNKRPSAAACVCFVLSWPIFNACTIIFLFTLPNTFCFIAFHLLPSLLPALIAFEQQSMTQRCSQVFRVNVKAWTHKATHTRTSSHTCTVCWIKRTGVTRGVNPGLVQSLLVTDTIERGEWVGMTPPENINGITWEYSIWVDCIGGAGVYQDGSTLRGKVQLHSDADVNGR